MSQEHKRTFEELDSPEVSENKRVGLALNSPMASLATNITNKMEEFMSKENVSEELKSVVGLLYECINEKVGDLQTEINGVGDEVRNSKTMLDGKLNTYHKSNDLRVTRLERENKLLRQEINELKKRVESQETYSRRSNMVFSGVPEESTENLFKWFNTTMRMTLGIEDRIQLERIHRDGPRNDSPYNTRPRNILVRFKYYPDRVAVFDKRRLLKGTGIFIGDDHIPEVLERRRRLEPIAKEARSQNMKATVISDKLIVDGSRYTVDTLYELPESLIPISNSERHSDSRISFFRKFSKLSNHHPSSFVIDDHEYCCNEQYFLSQKCLGFGQRRAAENILNTSDAAQMVKFSKVCKGTSQNWKHEKAYEVMKKGLEAKFNQDESCKEYLINTGEKLLIEGSKYDKVWGAGVDFNDDKIDDDELPGQNELGRALMEVRFELKTLESQMLSPQSTY